MYLQTITVLISAFCWDNQKFIKKRNSTELCCPRRLWNGFVSMTFTFNGIVFCNTAHRTLIVRRCQFLPPFPDISSIYSHSMFGYIVSFQRLIYIWNESHASDLLSWIETGDFLSLMWHCHKHSSCVRIQSLDQKYLEKCMYIEHIWDFFLVIIF